MKERTRSRWQKLLAVVLSVTMLLGVLPVALLTSADDEDITFAGFASWTLASDGELSLAEGVSGNGAGVTLTKDGGTAVLYSDPMSVEAGLTYNVGASVKVPAGGKAEVYAVAFSDAAGSTMLGEAKLVGSPASNGEFASVTADFAVPTGAKCIRVGALLGDSNAAAGDTYIVDDVYAKPYTAAVDMESTAGTHWYEWDANAYGEEYYAETVATGYADAGSLHMHTQDAKGDVYVAIDPVIPEDYVDGDTFTLKLSIKGTFGYIGSNDGLKWDTGGGKWGGIVLSGTTCDDGKAFANGSSWQQLTVENIAFGGTSLFIVLGKYTGASDIYLDNITLLDKNGNDVLAGKGTFCNANEEQLLSGVNRLENGDFEDVLYSYLPLSEFNGDFEDLTVNGAEGWSLIGNATGDELSVGMNDEEKYLIVTRGETAAAGDSTTVLVSPTVSVDAGKRYAVGMDVMGTASGAVRGVFRDADGNELSSWDSRQTVTGTDAWTASPLMELTVPANAATFELRINVQGAAGTKLCMDNVKLHPYAPAAAETVVEVSKLVADTAATTGMWYYLSSDLYTYTDTKYAEIVETGSSESNPGALHLVHGSANDADLIVGLNPGTLTAGQEYVLSGKMKGSVQTASSNKDGFRIEGYDYDAGTGADRQLFPYTAGATLTEWTNFSFSYTPGNAAAANGFWLMISRYAGAGEVWLDELKLVKVGDATGTDLLNGAGNFYTVKTAGDETDDTKQETEITYPAIAGSWSTAGNNEWYQLGDNNDYKHDADRYAEIVEAGASESNPGAMHLYHKDSNVADLVVGIKVPDLVQGKEYTVRLKIKGAVGYSNTADGNGLRVSGYAHESEKVLPITGFTTYSEWTTVETTYTAGANAVSSGLWLNLGRYGGTWDVYIDEVQVLDGTTDLLAGAGNFYTETVKSETEITLLTIAASGDTKYQWYNNNGYTTSSENTMEIVETGADDPGALHIYQANVAKTDMQLGLWVDNIPAGSYTLKLKAKGDLGLDGQTCRFFPYVLENEASLNLHAKAGTENLANWTELSWSITTASETSYFLFYFSKYNWATDFYVDNVCLLDASGNDVLKGVGNFCVETVKQETTITVPELAMSNDGWMYGTDVAVDTWYKPAGYSYGDTNKAEIVATGSSDANPGSLHFYKTVSAGGTDVYVGINTSSDLLKAGSTYTLKMKVKGQVGNGAGDGLRVWGGYGADNTITQLSTYDSAETAKLVANTTYSNWTEFTFTYTHAATQSGAENEFWFNLPGYSGTYDLYVDEIQLLDASGNDVLNGAGNFYTETTVSDLPTLTEVDASNPANITMPPENEWYTVTGTASLSGWEELTFNKSVGRYAEIVEAGSSDENPGSLHMVHTSADAGNLTVGIIPDGLQVGKTYTVSMKVKGSVGYSSGSDGFRVDGFGYGILNDDTSARVPLTANTQYNWETFTVTFAATQNEVDYGLWLRLSKYSHASELWLDEVQVLDENNKDLLAGAGSFCNSLLVDDSEPVDDGTWVPDTTKNLFPHGDMQNMGVLSIPGWTITGTAGLDAMTGAITLASGTTMRSLRYNVTPGTTYGVTADGSNLRVTVVFSNGTEVTLSNFAEMNYIEAPEGAEWLRVRIDAAGTGASVDTVTCAVPEEATDANLDFEYFTSHDMYGQMPLNWKGSSTGNMKISANTELTYRGNYSVQLSRSGGEASYSHIESTVAIPVVGGDDIELVVHMSSKNAISGNFTAYFQYLDKNGKALSGMVGQERALNTTDEWSEWSEFRLTHTVPKNAVGVTLLLRVGGNRADVVFDSLEFYNYTANDHIIYVEDFATPSSTGLPGGWKQGETAGEPVIESDGAAAISGTAADNAAIYTDLFTFKTDYVYNITANVLNTGTATGKLVIEALDWRDRLIKTVVNQDINNGSQTIVSDFTAPSATAYRVWIKKTGGEGTVSVNDITIKQISDPVGNVDWAGYWLAQEDDVDTMLGQPHPHCDRHYYFRQEINLESNVTSAQMQITADDKFTLYVNGEEVYKEESKGQSWDLPVTVDLSDYMTKGKNVIAVDLYNDIYAYGLLFDGIVKMDNDTSMRFYSTSDMLVARGTVGHTNTAGETPAPNPDFSEEDIQTFMNVDYVTEGHPAWSNAVEYARAGGGSWGALAFDPTEYSDYKLESNEFTFPNEVLVAGDVVEVTATLKIEEKLPTSTSFGINFLKRNTTTQVSTGSLTLADGATTDEWPIGEEFEATFEMRVPDFLAAGRYTVQFDKTIAIISDYFINNKVGDIEMVQPERELTTTSEVKVVNGKPTLYVNGEAKSPIWHSTQERETAFNADTVAKFGESGLDTIVSYVLMRSAAEDMYREDGSIDTGAIDSMILKALTANPDAQLMMHIDTSPPDWWLEANPDECVLLDNGTRSKEAFYSDKWKKDIGDYVVKVIDHIMAQPYANNIIGIKVVGGSTYEWQWWGITDGNGAVGDYSSVGTQKYREWLKKTYGTVEAMQAAYNDTSITFENALAPSREVRNESEYGTILHLQDSRRLVDYETFMSEAKTEAILYFTGLCKEAVDNRLVVGTYAGYILNGGTYEFTAGTANVMFQELLESDSIDFIKCPWSYGSTREVGWMTDYMGPVDSATLHGKLYVAEDDDRLNLHELSMAQDSRASVGWTRTTKQSVETIKRNAAYVLSKGQAITFYNLASTSYFHDDQFYGLIGEILEEANLSVAVEHKSVADIAVYVDGQSMLTLPRLTDNADGTVDYSNEIFAGALHGNQRKEFSHIGAPYDTYLLDDLADGLIAADDYKIHVMWLTTWIDEAERAAIEQQLQKDGNIIVWIFGAGMVDGETTDVQNMIDLIGMNLEVIGTGRQLFGSATIGGDADTTGTTKSHWLTEGMFGQSYGVVSTGVYTPVIAVRDADATPLAVHSLSGNYGGEIALAAKEIATADGGSWTSVYSAVPTVPQQLFRNMLEHVGGHIYDDNASDVVFASENYVSVHSLFAGERTIKLPGNYAVYDVYNQEVYSADTDEITYTAYDMETRLFRLSEVNTIQTYVGQTSGGTVSPKGLSNLKAGDDFTVTITPDDGYRINYVVIDGEKTVLSGNTYTFEDVQASHTVMAYFSKIYDRPVTDDDEPEDDDTPGTTDQPSDSTTPDDTPTDTNQPVINDNPPATDTPDEEEPVDQPEGDGNEGDGSQTIVEWYDETTTSVNWPAVIGLIAGIVAGIGLLLFLILFFVKRKKKKDEETATPAN